MVRKGCNFNLTKAGGIANTTFFQGSIGVFVKKYRVLRLEFPF